MVSMAGALKMKMPQLKIRGRAPGKGRPAFEQPSCLCPHRPRRAEGRQQWFSMCREDLIFRRNSLVEGVIKAAILACRHMNVDGTKAAYDLTAGIGVKQCMELSDGIASVLWQHDLKAFWSRTGKGMAFTPRYDAHIILPGDWPQSSKGGQQYILRYGGGQHARRFQRLFWKSLKERRGSFSVRPHRSAGGGCHPPSPEE